MIIHFMNQQFTALREAISKCTATMNVMIGLQNNPQSKCNTEIPAIRQILPHNAPKMLCNSENELIKVEKMLEKEEIFVEIVRLLHLKLL